MEIVRQDSVWYDIFYRELTTGLRRGEICGSSGQTSMRRMEPSGSAVPSMRSAVLADALGHQDRYGNPNILLPPSTAELLRKRRRSSMTEWIFPNPMKPEHPTRPSAAYERTKVLLKQAGLPELRFHDLRHTFAAHALASGVDVKTLFGILGYTRTAFTLDTYTHTTGDMQKRAAEIVEEFLTDIFREELQSWEESAKAAKAPSA